MAEKKDQIFEQLRMLWEQNIKPHMLYKILKIHSDGEFHRGKDIINLGYDLTEVYDSIELLVVKGDLTRDGKKTMITPKGKKTLEQIDEVVSIATKYV